MLQILALIAILQLVLVAAATGLEAAWLAGRISLGLIRSTQSIPRGLYTQYQLARVFWRPRYLGSIESLPQHLQVEALRPQQ